MAVRREHKYQGTDPRRPCSFIAKGEMCGLSFEQHRDRQWHKYDPNMVDGACKKCGLMADKHYNPERERRSWHDFIGPDDAGPDTPCSRMIRGKVCDRPKKYHKGKAPLRKQHNFVGDLDGPCEKCGFPARAHSGKRRPAPDPYLGIDGEGKGRRDHKYVFLAVSDETGKHRWQLENEEGLGTEEILDFLFSIPYRRMFAYSFGYDLTKMLERMDNGRLYVLFRPELRQRRVSEKEKAEDPEKAESNRARGPVPVRWKKYKVNLVGTKFTVTLGTGKNKKTRIIWDIWKFYQSRFVDALRLWSVGTKEEVDLIASMKDQRDEFDKLPPALVREYCFLEVRLMAELTRRLVDAHEAVGLKLTSFYGAGSCAGAMLKKMGIREQIRPCPPQMALPVSMAFFGGRFENSRMGRVRQQAYNLDISSAYPYQLCSLPCLVHGQWEYITDRKKLNGKRYALVKYGYRKDRGIIQNDWAPFPFRDANGSICYPRVSGGGWIWLDEYLAGEKLFFPMVEFRGAWAYHQECECQPFKQIPIYYRERCRIGKEGPGIVLKLGPNSCYGKLAQSVGNAVYNNWMWAGMITSGCRAQFLELLGLHENRGNCLMVATDGAYTLEDIQPPSPKDTGTFDVSICKKHNKTCLECEPIYKPLGGWEKDKITKGIFLAQPGVYFPWDPTKEEIKKVRGRGVGKGAVLENWQRIVDAYNERGASLGRDEEGNNIPNEVHLANVSRFCGAKTSISVAHVGNSLHFHRADGDHVGGMHLNPPIPPEPCYGQWMTREVVMKFDPMPKREGVNRDGTLRLRSMPITQMSMPYTKAIVSPDARVLKDLQQELMEQPDIDFIDWEDEDGEF